ncbi:uncharacterized protein PGTG_09164 [Puccinia graminis f. sp. tritici CRL 75-36-700-3]|uniref:Phosphatidylinositol 4-kinase n=1 Tax=Puccinia graminis f. sp. tritici (strain CRL 75-36-700-3 / race SCCL) TaxID=418459 RepID=E3KFS6_PUCGT|nr:uncharacterized protein PGTG_09164 [Puccinia graminis f. sp. tritici CRL 75-36-700-3]EFP83211.2 hypothetical protein PGTG_09164 [Puccinia graminis f. sp. tritici CRL 75-36-700-3]
MERELLLNKHKKNVEGDNDSNLKRYKLNIDSSRSLFTKIKSSIPTNNNNSSSSSSDRHAGALKSPNTIISNKPSTRISKGKLKKRVRAEITQRPIPVIETVFVSQAQPNNFTQQAKPSQPRTLDHLAPTSHQEFASVVNSLKRSISNPTKPLLPKLNQSGSSGSYFCRDYINQSSSTSLHQNNQDTNPEKIEIVGIFKPKDEEPYGAMNPKWTKWAHRVFLAPLIGGFGRGCLIPNLSYLSEAAASLLDRRLKTFIVPRTEVISISSPTFFYSWLDLRKPELPAKPGSFQLFCQGFQDASIFLKKHPWPGFPISEDQTENIRKKPRRFSLFRLLCGHRRNRDTDSEDEDPTFVEHTPDPLPKVRSCTGSCRDHNKDWVWTFELMEDFRIEMEKLVILDYLMRNTDRGLDNFMIKVCNAPSCTNRRHVKTSNTSPSTSTIPQGENTNQEPTSEDYQHRPHCHVAAIDNSLAFPHHHPNGWREYAYGWLFLPASLIGQPFSRTTREYFLPLLTSQQWWAETVHELRKLFGIDPDFNVQMFERQMAVMKGQAWNIVESLKHEEEGPLELCRRQKALVWDEPVQVVWDELDQAIDFDSPGEIDHGSGELQSTSAPASQSYFPTPPMKIVTPSKRPAIRRGWSSRTSGSHKIPPRPVGLASHHLALDGARGLDVMKQMDALEAWHTESEIDVPSFRSHQRAQHRSTLKPRSLHHLTKPRSQDQQDPEFEGRRVSGDEQPSAPNGLLPSRRTKSINNITAVDEARPLLQAHRAKIQSRIERGKLGLISIRSNPHATRLGSYKTKKAKAGPSLPAEEQVFSDPEPDADDEEDEDPEDLENIDADEDVDDGRQITIGVVEKLEFVVAQPFFKNC